MGLLRLAAVVLLLVCVLEAAVAVTPPKEKQALLDFKAAVKNPKSDSIVWSILDRWDAHTDPCDDGWYQLSCSGGHVNQIYFYYLGTDDEDEDISPFDVNIGPTFAQLDRLQYLAIPVKGNPFPLAVTKLLRLSHLDFRGASGTIPTDIGKLTSLKELSLGGSLTGAIPASIGKLTSLRVLGLGGNQLSGAIPSSIGKLLELRDFSVNDNKLSGALPKELGNLSKLVWLYAWSNQLSGPIPASLGNIKSLVFLELSDNKLSGSIPPELASLPNLIRFRATNNRFTGPVPPALNKVAQVFLSINFLNGPVPPSDAEHTYDTNCLGLTPCNRVVANQRTIGDCAKIYPSLKATCPN